MSRTEYFARECRKALAYADLAERAGQIDLADQCGAIAGNKLQQAYSLGLLADKVVPLPPVLPSLVVDCPACWHGWRDSGNTTVRCIQCNGTGRVATNGGEP